MEKGNKGKQAKRNSDLTLWIKVQITKKAVMTEQVDVGGLMTIAFSLIGTHSSGGEVGSHGDRHRQQCGGMGTPGSGPSPLPGIPRRRPKVSKTLSTLLQRRKFKTECRKSIGHGLLRKPVQT